MWKKQQQLNGIGELKRVASIFTFKQNYNNLSAVKGNRVKCLHLQSYVNVKVCKRKFGFLHEEGQRVHTNQRASPQTSQAVWYSFAYLFDEDVYIACACIPDHVSKFNYTSLSLPIYIYNNPKTPRDI